MTNWESTLAALRRNDASVTSVDIDADWKRVYGWSTPDRYALSLGNALLNNTSVTSLNLDMSQLWRLETPNATDDWALLLNYVATSSVLQTVCMESTSSPESDDHVQKTVMFSERLLLAVGSNANICALKLDGFIQYEPSDMLALLNQKTTLQELALDISRHVLSDESRLNVVDALANNTRITDLTLFLGFDPDDVELRVCDHALHALCQNTTLQKLSLDFYGHVAENYSVSGLAWSSLLQSKVPLLSLRLRSISFNGDEMEHLLRGLFGRVPAIDLELDDCFFSNDAIDSLMRIEPDIQKGRVSKLTVTEPRCGPRHNPAWNKLVAALYPLSGVSRSVHFTVGQFPELTCALLGQLTIKSPTQMMSFTLQHMSPVEIEALVAFVKSAIHLKELSVNFSHRHGNLFLGLSNLRTMVEDALRENGSVVNVCQGLTNKYCERNTNLCLLLKRRPMPLDELSLVPSLFRAAQAANKMRAHFIFTGLLGCDHLDNVRRRGHLRVHPVSDLE
jgi:hypothetical protein